MASIVSCTFIGYIKVKFILLTLSYAHAAFFFLSTNESVVSDECALVYSSLVMYSQSSPE